MDLRQRTPTFSHTVLTNDQSKTAHSYAVLLSFEELLPLRTSEPARTSMGSGRQKNRGCVGTQPPVRIDGNVQLVGAELRRDDGGLDGVIDVLGLGAALGDGPLVPDTV